MKHSYTLTGMTCTSCAASVKKLLSTVTGISDIDISLSEQKVTIDMEKEIPLPVLQQALQSAPRYQIAGQFHALSPFSFWKDTSVWTRAGKNTLTCLIGCSIGDFGMIIYLQSYHHNMNMYLMMILAMITGLSTSVMLETVILKISEKFTWSLALKTAVGMSFLSMLAMELAENATDLLLTGGQVRPSEPFYWYALAISLVAGFVVPLPYNYYKLKKYGKACH